MFGSKPTTGADCLMSSARACGSPSTMSMRTTSARPRSRRRMAVLCPTNPLPTTVTRIEDAPGDRLAALILASAQAGEPRDHGVGDLLGPGRGGVVPRRPQVVRDRATLRDHGRDGLLEAIARLGLAEVTEQ